MKKTLFVLLLIGCFFITGCEEAKGDAILKTYNGIEYYEGVYEVNLTNKTEPVDNIAISDVETALNVTNAIVDGYKKQGKFADFEAQEIFYDTKDKMWIISYWEESDEPVLGSSFTIAVSAKNAEVKMWVGE